MTKQIKFGSGGTFVKLQTVSDYVNFYTNVLRNKPDNANWNFRLTYLDAFAGSGSMPTGAELPMIDCVEDVDLIAEGSALRALKVDYPFDNYIFSDTKSSNVSELLELKKSFPSLASRIAVSHKDANETVCEFCKSMGSRDRAVIFLDPFGNQVNWHTLEVIASTEKVDLWYLFPSWWGVVRQISNDGKIHADAENSLDRIFGTGNWRDEVVQYRQMDDLFGSSVVPEKIATVDSVTRFMIGRMETIFGAGVSKRWLPLGRNGQPGYSLLFACANKRSVARQLAHKVANHVMKRS